MKKKWDIAKFNFKHGHKEKAFEKWFHNSQCYGNEKRFYESAWQAACEWMNSRKCCECVKYLCDGCPIYYHLPEETYKNFCCKYWTPKE